MHLLRAKAGSAVDETEAVDLGQTPGDVVFLSAADTELASLAGARAGFGDDFPSLRLANLMQLAHPMSVDLYVESVVANARLVVARVLGGAGYWPYGVEQLVETCRAGSTPLALLPGDDQPDPEFAALGTDLILSRIGVCKVWPVATKSTMASDMPVSGPSSTES